MDDPRKVILRPVVTEKMTFLTERTNKEGVAQNAYAFQVNPRATKIEIRQAVEAIFNVKVKAVRTLWRTGKIRKTRKGGITHTSDVKRAIVTLKEGQKIDYGH